MAGTITEQQSHTTALLQAVSAVDERVVWVAGHRATWVRTVSPSKSPMPSPLESLSLMCSSEHSVLLPAGAVVAHGWPNGPSYGKTM